MKKFIEKLVPKNDKLGHFFLWTMLYVCLIYLLNFVNNIWQLTLPSKKISLIIVHVTAFLKEVVHDWLQNKGTPEIMDYIYSVLAPTLLYIND